MAWRVTGGAQVGGVGVAISGTLGQGVVGGVVSSGVFFVVVVPIVIFPPVSPSGAGPPCGSVSVPFSAAASQRGRSRAGAAAWRGTTRKRWAPVG